MDDSGGRNEGLDGRSPNLQSENHHFAKSYPAIQRAEKKNSQRLEFAKEDALSQEEEHFQASS